MRNGSGEPSRQRKELKQRPCDGRENGELQEPWESLCGVSELWGLRAVGSALGDPAGRGQARQCAVGVLRILIFILRPMESFEGIKAGGLCCESIMEQLGNSLGTIIIAIAEARET